VDSIYPAIPEDGLVKNKMETLVYYAMTSPEKLDRIGEYLEQRISRDIYRGRTELVGIGIEAMDQVMPMRIKKSSVVRGEKALGN
jgi:hypothetical protein